MNTDVTTTELSVPRTMPPTRQDPFAPQVLAQVGGLRVVRPGLRSGRYRQGV